MTEAEARDWLRDNFDVPRETWQRLDRFLDLLDHEMRRQNLISKASAQQIWTRHIADSAQLLRHALQHQSPKALWLDLGTGAGFPGVVISILSGCTVHMVESRKRRIDFLDRVIAELGLERAVVLGDRLENIDGFSADVITARAFAPLDKLLALSHRFSTENTLWLLPKGKNAVRELQGLSPKAQKMFHVEQSLTDSEAKILIGKGRISAEFCG